MPQSYWEVDVPTKNNDLQGRRLHVFVGLADSPITARKAAHDAYDKALLLHQAGQEIPFEFVSGWGARGLRPDWDLDWNKATAAPWVNPHGLLGTHRTF
ncbi:MULTISPECIES: hypothetical protein [Streptomyces]|uniref:hypothetical protein n=1 Tax=Streptomyces TaxID=1883 RepID=UPI0009523E0F|nr:hypothetical protein [Streptomyces acidiscabies]